MPRLYLFVLCVLFALVVEAESIPPAAQKSTTGTKPPAQPIEVSGLQVAHALRTEYGLHGAVALTRTAHKILDSFVDESQAAFLWQNALDGVEAESLQKSQQPLFGIDTHALAGLVLAANTHGMTTDQWQRTLLPLDLNQAPLKPLLDSRDELDIYLQLPAIWDRFLQAMRERPHVHWQQVFGPILESPPVSVATDYPSPWDALLKWTSQPEREKHLADLALLVNQHQHQLPLMQRALLKKLIQLTLNKDRQQPLAAALNWLEAFSVARTYLANWLKTEGKRLEPLVENNDTWFVAHHDIMLRIDERLPELLERSFQQLKQPDQAPPVDFQQHMAAVFFSLPDIHAYLAQPFRRLLQQQLEVCLNISEEETPLPDEPIEQRQYSGCVEDLAHWAGVLAKSDEMAGNLNPPEDDEALARVLELPPWQTINTLYAMEAQEDCLTEEQRKANPFEWFLGSESLIWFNERWPQYLEKYHPTAFLQWPISTGWQLQKGYACLKQPIHATLARRLAQVVAQWQRVKHLITAVADEYRQQHLKPGSDIDLLGSVQQASHYRPENLQIGPCDPKNTCGVHSQLEPSRALLALFPNHLLLADQLNLGTIRLCYDDVGWEDREAGPTHLSNPAVANYYGHLALSLKGFYNDKLVFARRIQSLQKYHYLFGRNDDKVLQLSCPLPILGEQIVTQLPEGTHGLLPNRLTFLTAARANADAIVKHNWTDGEEWRDRLADDLRVKVLASNSLDDVRLLVEEKFIEHTSAVQKTLYGLLLEQQQARSETQQALLDAARKYHLYRQLVQAMASVFITDKLLFDPAVHGIFYGSERLPDRAMLAGFYRQQIAIREANARFERYQEKAVQTWLKQPQDEAGENERKAFRALDPVLLKLLEQKNRASNPLGKL